MLLSIMVFRQNSGYKGISWCRQLCEKIWESGRRVLVANDFDILGGIIYKCYNRALVFGPSLQEEDVLWKGHNMFSGTRSYNYFRIKVTKRITDITFFFLCLDLRKHLTGNQVSTVYSMEGIIDMTKKRNVHTIKHINEIGIYQNLPQTCN